MSRPGKQIIYGLVYFFIIALLIAFIYVEFLRAPSGCANGRLDKGEEGVDCGDICGNTCVPNDLQKIEAAGSINLFSAAPRTIGLAVKIQNANSGLAARSFSYQFNIYDSSGARVDAIRGNSFIYAGDVKYLTAIKTGIDYVPYGADLEIGEPDWVKSEKWQRPELSGIQGLKTSVSSSSVKISGKVANQDAATLVSMKIVAIFNDQYGFPLGISETEIENVAPEEAVNFTILHPYVSGIDISRTIFNISAKRQ